MELIPYQACLSSEGWHPVRILSSSGESSYLVFVSPWGDPQENICECKGYIYRGYCKHQEEASKRVCRWTELNDPQQQIPDERFSKICPRCGGRTRWEVDVVAV